mmetsp:Transcript_21850/g.56989  ORF Transcript_21850/g.56989 Transcript_21850/m.56989 type:complete len:249 (+) Transcript_21850:607-1353(+)
MKPFDLQVHHHSAHTLRVVASPTLACWLPWAVPASLQHMWLGCPLTPPLPLHTHCPWGNQIVQLSFHQQRNLAVGRSQGPLDLSPPVEMGCCCGRCCLHAWSRPVWRWGRTAWLSLQCARTPMAWSLRRTLPTVCGRCGSWRICACSSSRALQTMEALTRLQRRAPEVLWLCARWHRCRAVRSRAWLPVLKLQQWGRWVGWWQCSVVATTCSAGRGATALYLHPHPHQNHHLKLQTLLPRVGMQPWSQ